ncbi:MAG: pantoate--beta-alanine ligase [Deltaproteobacteria bacterium]|nr:pantoate--beta-alanine ligase [Deltaproteobacteria bacterium]
MEVFTDKELMRRWSRSVRAAGETVALVPTMGALHEGHLRLVELAAREADRVVVSIYVNPTQFDRAEDFAKYPRTLHSDLKALEGSPCKAVFAPTEMYLPGNTTWVTVDGLTEHLCGKTRPGHFRGVTTIVSKFLHVVEPDVALFGNKDYQQRRVLEQMVRDQDLPIRVVAAPTVREPDGLAMSSRNVRLDPTARLAATAIPKALDAARAAFDRGERGVAALSEPVRQALIAAGGTIDYVEIADDQTLAPLPSDRHVAAPAVLAIAAFFGGVRLIDNVALH